MKNPWLNCSAQNKFICADDAKYLSLFEEFNTRKPEEFKIQFKTVFAEPFIGNPKTASVIFLSLNPGFTPEGEDIRSDEDSHRDPHFAQTINQNLKHQQNEYSFYLLNPQFDFTGGFKWWDKKLKALIEAVKADGYSDARRLVANNIACIEYFPYHSKKYAAFGKKMLKNCGLEKDFLLSSQKYNVDLIEEAIKEKKLIIVMRSKKKWELTLGKTFPSLKSPQNVCVSENNCTSKVFEEIRKRIEGKIRS